MALDQLLEREAHLLLDIARRVDVAGDAENLRPAVSRPANPREPRRAAAQDGWHDRDSLDIVDRCRTTVESDSCRKWRFQPRLALASFEAFEKPSLLAADIRTGAPVQIEVEVVARAASVFADQSPRISFVDRRLQPQRFVIEFAADVNVAVVHAHPDRCQQAAFDQFLWVVAQDVAIL